MNCLGFSFSFKNKVLFVCFLVLGITSWIILPHSALAEVIFQWDCENSPTGDLDNGTPNQPFSDVNVYAGVRVEISGVIAHSGEKSIKIGYPGNEAGVELKVGPFQAGRSLYVRKYEYFATGWEGNWPVGLKTSRYFTTNNWSTGGEPNGYAYNSEKLIFQSYNSTCDEDYGMELNCAIFNLDLRASYTPDKIFGNGLPYIRTGHWYKFETWMVLNSATDVADGILKIWIDDVLVYSNTNVIWRSTSRGCPNGTNWKSMWFGGNYSGAICGGPSQTLYRYIDDLYVSTTLDREGVGQVPSVPKNLRKAQ